MIEFFRVWDEFGEGIIEFDELKCFFDRILEKLMRKEIDLLVN